MKNFDHSEFDKIKFPIVRKVSARTLAQDIKGFNPNDPKDVKEWGDMFEEIWAKVKKEFDKKGILMPEIVIDTTPGPITYGVKIEDEKGNTQDTWLNMVWGND
jgi:hypothetical protein